VANIVVAEKEIESSTNTTRSDESAFVNITANIAPIKNVLKI
jgi:hypothetical protein